MAILSTIVYPRLIRGPLSLAAAALAMLAAFTPLSPAVALDEGVIATVNGEPILESTLTAVQQQLAGRQQVPATEQIIEELVNLNLLSQLATAEGLHESDGIKSVLELQRLQVLANAYMGKLSEGLELPDEMLRAEYDKQIASVAQNEYKASQILLESEDDARDVITKLVEGEDFAELAKSRSTDPGGKNGGDLGWFQAAAMPEAMVAALGKLQPGNFTREPVQTDFGWHVLLLEEQRGSQVPDFEAVKPQIRNALLAQEVQKKITELRKDAEIDFGQ